VLPHRRRRLALERRPRLCPPPHHAPRHAPCAEQIGVTEFDGYEKDEADSKIFAIVKDGVSVESANAGDEVYVVLDHTPFYGESGGQVGDTGSFSANGKRIADIIDTQKPLEDFIVHEAVLTAPIKLGGSVHAAIDAHLRNRTRANHSATHLLHKALRDQLGAHVTQKGSLVDADRLRFDFSHPKAVSAEEIAAIEREVNSVIARGGAVDCKEMAPDDAIKAGAMALFGEKYGERVRVLSMGIRDQALGISEENHSSNPQSPMPNPYSIELCGGTHVRNVSDIQLFKITSEGSVASGIRRIEAVTGERVREHLESELEKLRAQEQKLRDDQAQLLTSLSRELKKSTAAPENLGKNIFADYARISATLTQSIAQLQEENKKLSKELAEKKKQAALGDSKAEVEKIGAYTFIGKIFDGLDPKELRDVANGFLKQADIVAVGTNVEGKGSVVVGVNKPHSEKISAVALVQTAVAELGGKGGGGKPDMAQGGGPEAGKLASALEKIKNLID
jgi:alanyl-tRNA synthetase